jgi:hypothetical protein
LFHTDDAQAQQQRVDQQTQNHQQPLLDWRAVPNRSAESADRSFVTEPAVMLFDAPMNPVGTPTQHAASASEPSVDPITKPDGWRSRIFKDPSTFSSGEPAPVAPVTGATEQASVSNETKPGVSVARTTELTHDDKVRMAQSVSADVQVGRDDKGKGGPELQ